MPKGEVKSKIVRPLAKGQITIPAEFRERLGIEADTLLSISLVGGKLEIVPVKLGEESLRLYSDEEIQRFLEEDKIDSETAAKVRQLLARGEL
jgi:AbrB family looped-hinge helix DNA binding protein